MSLAYRIPSKSLIIVTLLGLRLPYALSAEKQLPGFYYDAKSNRYFSDGTPTFSIRPAQGSNYTDRIEASIDGGEFTQSTGKLKVEQEGLHLIRFRSFDPVTKWSPVQEFRIYVDLTPPLLQASWQGITAGDEAHLFVGASAKLSVVAQDALSGVKSIVVEQNNQSRELSGPIQFKAEGAYHLKFTAIDHVMNNAAPLELAFTVDLKPPVTQIELKGAIQKDGKGTFLPPGTPITLKAIDEESGVQLTEYQIDDGPVTPYRQPLLLSQAKTTLKYRSTDRVGNVEAWKTQVLYQDTQPPKLIAEKSGQFIAAHGKIYALPGFSLSFKASDDETGISSLEVSQGTKGFEKTTQTQFVFQDPGEFSIAYRAQDFAGNIADSDNYSIVIDSTPPVSTLSAQDPLIPGKEGELQTWVPNRLELTAKDDGVGLDKIEFSYDGKTFAPYTIPIDVAQWNQPKRTLFWRSVDRLGNREKTKSAIVWVKTDRPRVELFVESEKFPEVPLSSLSQSKPISEKKTEKPKDELSASQTAVESASPKKVADLKSKPSQKTISKREIASENKKHKSKDQKKKKKRKKEVDE